MSTTLLQILIYAIEWYHYKNHIRWPWPTFSRSTLQIVTKLFLQICFHLYGTHRQVALIMLVDQNRTMLLLSQCTKLKLVAYHVAHIQVFYNYITLLEWPIIKYYNLLFNSKSIKWKKMEKRQRSSLQAHKKIK